MVLGSADDARLSGAWRTSRRRLRAYSYSGGHHVAALLRIRDAEAVVMLNETILPPEGKRIMMGWALALSAFGPDGFYVLFTDDRRKLMEAPSVTFSADRYLCP